LRRCSLRWKLEVRVVATDGDLDRAVPIARTTDPGVVRAAADAVVAEAQGEAAALERQDPVLGVVARSEAEKLARIFDAIEHGVAPPTLGLVPR
jgi:hypothetical protein